MPRELRTLTTREDVARVVGDDPFLRHEILPVPVGAWALGEAVAVTRPRHTGVPGISAWPAPSASLGSGLADLADLLAAVLRRGGPGHRLVPTVSVPLGRLDLLELAVAGSARVGDGGDWEWMSTTREPPAYAPEGLVVELDDRTDAAELRALVDADNPSSEGEPGTGRTELWLGVREAGRIVACGAYHRTPNGSPHLAGILVARDARGRGLGRAVTSALTRHGVRETGACTLGMYADNATARGLYHSLGYETAHAWASRGLAWS